MSRWRAPQAPASPYITPEGAAALRAELKELWHQQRPEVVRALAAAAAEGDRSENAEYIYRKKQLGEIDRRVRYLSKRLDAIKVVDRLPGDQQRVRFGAWVTVSDTAGGEKTWRIVGADETHAGKGWISIDSPMARALLGKAPGDEIAVDLPEGRVVLVVEGVGYEDPTPS